MIIEKIGTGATVEEAYDQAKTLLNAPETAELNHEVLEYPKKKLFSKIPAQVKVWYEIPDAPVKAEPKAEPVKAAPKKAEPAKPVSKPASKPAPAPKKPVSPKAESKKEETAPVEAAPEKVEEKPAPVVETRVPFEITDDDKLANLLKTIIKGMSIDEFELSGEKVAETGEIIYNVSCGDNDGVLIGRRGDTLDSIQYILRLSLNRGIDDDKHTKVCVNVGNYREKRNENLRALAAKHARQVLKYGRNAVLEPMNPYERRIIHTAIQEIEGVTSHSVGSDGGRRVVISLEEGVQPTHPARGGYNNRGRGGYNNRGRGGYNKGGYNKGGYNKNRGNGRDGYQKREAYQPSVTREPRKDTAGSLYGKIEIPAKKEDE